MVSCVTRSILNVHGGYHPSDKPHSVIIGDGLPVSLAGPERLELRVIHHFRITEVPDQRETWAVGSVGYFYSLDDRNGHEIIAYHWHPSGLSPIRFPHLHIGAAARCQREDLAAAHCPTGTIAVGDFLRFIIVDFQVEPVRTDWADVLAEARRSFEH